MNSPQPLCHQLSRETVARVVQDFYRRVLAEPGLAGYFGHIGDWPQHESHITDFWWGLMGGVVESPRPRAMEHGHRDLDFGPQELALWLALFERTLQDLLPEDAAGQWAVLAQQIGRMMAERGMLSRDSPVRPKAIATE